MACSPKDRRPRNIKLPDLELLLMGVTGHGKSATGNTILGREQFVSEGGWGSVTKDFHEGYTQSDGRTIKVVDIPGFADTDENPQGDRNKLAIDALSKALAKFPNGFSAVLLVASYSHRLTKEVQKALNYVYDEFDKEAFKSFGVLVVTHGEAFERDQKRRNIEFYTWLKNNCSLFLSMCGERYILFDNETEDLQKKQRQVEQLFSLIDGMGNENKRYTPTICRFQGENKGEFESGRERAIRNENISRRLGLLKDRIAKSQIDPEELRLEVSSIRDEIESMETSVDKKRFIKTLLKLERDAYKNPDVINELQSDLAKDSQQGTWWETITNGVASFFKAVNHPVFQVAATLVGTFFGWKRITNS